MLGVRRWRELVADRKKWKDIVDRPKPTVGCSANGRRSGKYRRSSSAGSEKMERVGGR